MRPHYLYLSLVTLMPSALAQTQDFAQCQPTVLGPQKIQAQSQNTPDVQRIQELEQLLVDFRAIRQSLEGVKRVPTGFVQNCLTSKRAMVTLHFSKLSPTTQKTHNALKLMAQLLDVNLEYKDSIKFYQAAYESDPADTESALRGFKMYAEIELQNFSLNVKNMTKDQKKEALMVMLQKGYSIADNPKFDQEQRVWALEQVRGILAVNELREQIEEPYWKRVINLDPKSDTALRELMNIYERRADYGLMSFYATKLAANAKLQNTDVSKIGTALIKAEDYSALLKVGIDLCKKFPDNADAWGYLGIAEQKLKLFEKASEHLEKAIGLKSANPAVKTSFAALQEELGDKAVQDKNWIEAMTSYREALKYNKNSIQLKKKTAYLILDYYADLKFPKTNSTKKDMDFGLDLMKEALASKVPLMADYATSIRLAEHSSSPASFKHLCDKYQTERPSGLSSDIVRSCVSVYRSAGLEGKARGIVDLALSKIQEPPAKQEFLRALK